MSAWSCKLIALDQNGNQKWVFTQSVPSCNSFTVPTVGPDGTIYAALIVGVSENINAAVYAVNPDGTQKWRFSTGSNVHRPIALGADTLYAVTGKKLIALTLGGEQKWIFEADAYIYHPVVGLDGTIYVSRTGKIIAVNPSGTQKWIFSTGNSWGGDFPPLAFGTDGTLYGGSNDGYFYAIGPDGTKKWSVPNKGYRFSGVAVGSDGTLYVAALTADASGYAYDDLTVYALNTDGSTQWQAPLGRRYYLGDLAIGSDGVVYVSAHQYSTGGGNIDDGKLFAFNPDGTQKWVFNTGPATLTSTVSLSTSGPAIGADGTLYLATKMSVFAIRSDSPGLAASPWPKFYGNNQNTGRAFP